MADADFEAPIRALQARVDDLARYPGDPEKEMRISSRGNELLLVDGTSMKYN